MAKDIKLSGCDSAAVFLMSLGEREAASVMKHLDLMEVRKLSEAMKALGTVTRDMADDVMTRFTNRVSREGPVKTASPGFVHRLLSDSIGETQASPFLARLFPDSGGLASLHLMQTREVVEALQGEHPQVLAIALACMDAAKSAEVLAALPTALAGDVLTRIARLEQISESALADLESILHQKFTQAASGKGRDLGGVVAAARILNCCQKSTESAVLEEMAIYDFELSDEVRDNMLTFESLENLDDRSMQTLLREVNARELSMSMKGASDAFKALVHRNMSTRTIELLNSDIEGLGAVRISDVETMQRRMVDVARMLLDEGLISFNGAADEEFL